MLVQREMVRALSVSEYSESLGGCCATQLARKRNPESRVPGAFQRDAAQGIGGLLAPGGRLAGLGRFNFRLARNTGVAVITSHNKTFRFDAIDVPSSRGLGNPCSLLSRYRKTSIPNREAIRRFTR